MYDSFKYFIGEILFLYLHAHARGNEKIKNIQYLCFVLRNYNIRSIENNIVSENLIDMPYTRLEKRGIIHDQGIMRTPRYRDDSDAYR